MVRGPVWGYKMCLPNSGPMFGMGLQNVFTQQWSEVRYGVTKCVFSTVVQCPVWGYNMCLLNNGPVWGYKMCLLNTGPRSCKRLQNVFVVNSVFISN